MPQTLLCALLDLEGPFSETVFRSSADEVALRQGLATEWLTDTSLPLLTEAKEVSVLNAINRVMGLRADRGDLQILLHQYATHRSFAAVARRADSVTERDLIEFIRAIAAAYAQCVGESIQSTRSRLLPEPGTTLDLPPADWTWHGLRDPSKNFVQLLAACGICLYLFRDSSRIIIDILVPQADSCRSEASVSVPLNITDDLQIGEVQRWLQETIERQRNCRFNDHPMSPARILYRWESSTERDMQIGSLNIAIIDVRRGAKSDMRITLPLKPSMDLPRLECKVPESAAADLLCHVYDSLVCRPTALVSEVTLSPEMEATPEPSKWHAVPAAIVTHIDSHETTESTMAIIVATLRFGDLPYAHHSAEINRRYCDRHGYGFRIIHPSRQAERHPIWFKVQGVRDLLSEAEFVLFLDADAYFVDHAKTIQSLINTHMGNADLLLGTNRRDASFTYSDEEANSGVFLVRNSDAAIGILDDWWNAPLQHCTKSLWRWPVEQDAFNAYVRTGRHANKIRVIHYAHMNGRDGRYIRHLMGLSEEERLGTLREDARLLESRCQAKHDK
jgi:hypothetical protein